MKNVSLDKFVSYIMALKPELCENKITVTNAIYDMGLDNYLDTLDEDIHLLVTFSKTYDRLLKEAF